MADGSQSDVNTDSVNTYNSIQPSSPLMEDANPVGINQTSDGKTQDVSDIHMDTNAANYIPSTDANLVEDLAGTPPLPESNAPVEEFPKQEPLESVVQSAQGNDNNVGTDSTLESQSMPSFGSIPVMGESVASSSVASQTQSSPESIQSPSAEQNVTEASPVSPSPDMSTPLSQPISSAFESQAASIESAPSFGSAAVSPLQSAETQPVESAASSESELTLPSQPMETSATPAFSETEIVNTLDNGKEEKKGGNAVVIILIVIIVALLLAVGYFAYKVFLA